MHGWVAYSHRVGDEATFGGELALVVGLGTIPYITSAHVQAHAYVSIYYTSRPTTMVLRACYCSVFELHFPEVICHMNDVTSVKYFSLEAFFFWRCLFLCLIHHGGYKCS